MQGDLILLDMQMPEGTAIWQSRSMRIYFIRF